MLKIIPAIDLKDGKCVRLQQGDFSRQTTYDESPVHMAKKWESLGAPIIHIVDLDGAKAGHSVNLNAISEICSSVTSPCELGGGIRTTDDVKRVLDAGVSRVIFGTALAKDPEFASVLVKKFSSDRIVAGLDIRDNKIVIEAWQTSANLQVVDLAKSLFNLGIRHFICTDIRTDGMFIGPNLDIVSNLCEIVPEGRVIASGGVGSVAHIKDLVELRKENLDGVIVGKALYDGRLKYMELTEMVESIKKFKE